MPARLRTFLWILFISFLFPYGPEAIAQNSIQMVNGHPRLFINSENLAEIRGRAGNDNKDVYATIKNWADSNWSNPAEQQRIYVSKDAGVLRYSLIYALGEIPGFDYSLHKIEDYGDKSVQIMMDLINAKRTDALEYVSIAYDWVNSKMTSDQKKVTVEYLKAIVGDIPKLRVSPRGYRFAGTPYCFYPGLAFYGDGIDDGRAQIYVNFIQKYFDDMRAINHMAGKDGGHAFGLGYAQATDAYGPFFTARDLYAMLTATDLTVNDTFNKYAYMKGFVTWLLYGTMPGPPSKHTYMANAVATLTKLEDIGNHQWNVYKTNHSLMQALRIMSSVAKKEGDLARAQLITWLINIRYQAPRQDTTWHIIFNDKSVAAVSPENLGVSKVKAFGWDESERKIDNYLDNPKAGLGHIYMRSSWDPSSNATHAVFKAPPYYYFGHQHFDSLNFSIFKGEPLVLANSGKYFPHYEGTEPDYPGNFVGYPHHWYYYERTVSGNSILVMDPNEKISMGPNKGGQILKDGGQRGLSDPGGVWGDVMEGGIRDWGGLIKHEDSLEFTYSCADATKAYNSIVNGKEYLTTGASPKVSLVQRDFTYLKSPDGNSDYFIVFDRIDSTNPSFKKVFLLHTIGEPVLSGNHSLIYGNATNGLFQSEDSNTFSVSQNTAKLFMKIVAPANTRAYKFGGRTKSVLTEAINETDGTNFQGAKVNVSVSSTVEFSDKPVVTIDGIRASDGKACKEVFMCDGKTETQLIGCIRGTRYFKQNYPLIHKIGDSVVQDYAWMIRESATNAWISYPHAFGEALLSTLYLADADEFGRWTLRIETTKDELHTNFMTVLHPTLDMSNTAMAETVAIDSSSGNMKGVLIKDPISPRLAMFSPTTGQVSDVAYGASYAGTGKHLITGLVPNATYDISKDGTKVGSKTASSQGIISFESPGGLSFRLVQTGGPIAPASDTTPPSTPTKVTATAVSSNQINLSWAPSTDNVGVAGYRVYRNGSQISVSATSSYSDTALAPSTTYSYTVSAFDAAFNVSSQSALASATTQAGTDQTPPVRYNASPTGTLPAGTTQATLSLATDETATCKYSTAAGVSYASMTNVFSVTRGTSHSTTISGLSNGGAYNYYVRCMDVSGNVNPDDFRISFSCGSSPQPAPAPAPAPAPPPPPPSGYVVNDFTFYSIPDIPRPAKGTSFQDPVFRSKITRITNAATDVPGSQYNYASPGYPKHNIENADGTRLVIQSYKWPGWHLWSAYPPFEKIRDLPKSLVDTKDPDVRWDNSDPAILYSTYGTKLYKYNIGKDQITLLHDFKTEFPNDPVTRVYTMEEGDASDDRRYWAFIVRCYDPNRKIQGLDPWYNRAYIVYDKDFYAKDDGKVISMIDDNSQNWRSAGFISMSPSGRYVWIGDNHYIYPRDFSKVWALGCAGHADMAISSEGREVVVCGARYYKDKKDMGIWIKMVDIETAETTWLASKGEGEYHISGNSHDKPGWAAISVYTPTYPEAPDNWAEHSIFMVELTTRTDPAPRVWRIAHTHTLRKGYSDDSFAKLNKAGTKIWFGSGWGQSYKDPGAQYDVYQIDLPGNWYQELMGNLPPTASISASSLSGKAPLTVKFTGSGKDADGTIASYGWNFGDGKTSSEQNPSHTYEIQGSYIITLRTMDDKGATGSASVTVNVVKSDTDPLKPTVSPPTDLRILRAQ